MPFLNPQCGPIMIEGDEKGDAIAVYIESIKPREDKPGGICCLIEEFGGLVGTTYTAMLNEPLPEIVKMIELYDLTVDWSNRITVAYKQLVRDLRCSPKI